ncbi:DIMBOA UDP-glucosyltransferase BX8-like [Hordeum vulgare]|nr:DIMBOA UDP-glucosyltransferase BX8-like [Hordeum vulgare]
MRKEEFGEQELVVAAVLADLLSPSGRDLTGLFGGLLRRRPYPHAPAAGSSALSVRQARRGTELAGLLHARGFAVTVFHARFNAPDPSRHPAYGFVPVPDGLPAGTPETVAATMEHILAVNTSWPFRERLAAPLDAPDARDEVA